MIFSCFYCFRHFKCLLCINGSFILLSSTSNVWLCSYNIQFRRVHVTHLIRCFISHLLLVSTRSHFQGWYIFGSHGNLLRHSVGYIYVYIWTLICLLDRRSPAINNCNSLCAIQGALEKESSNWDSSCICTPCCSCDSYALAGIRHWDMYSP